MKTAVEKSIALLQSSGLQFSRSSGCTSCHHQYLPQMAFGIARERGIAFDEAAARRQNDATLTLLNRVRQEAVENRDRIPDVPVSVSYALLSLSAGHHAADETTEAMARVIGAWQGNDGAFYPLPPMRPPIEAGAFTATALSLRALQLYGSNDEERIGRASQWLRAATPRTTEEHAMQLLGLAWAKAPADAVRTSADALLREQRPDGGWAQLPTVETDAYATGQALVALQASGHDVAERRVPPRRRVSASHAVFGWLVAGAQQDISRSAAEGEWLPPREASVDLRSGYQLGDDGDRAGIAGANNVRHDASRAPRWPCAPALSDRANGTDVIRLVPRQE